MTLIKRTSRDLFLSSAHICCSCSSLVWRNYHYPVMLSEASDALTLTTGEPLRILGCDWSIVLNTAFLLVNV